MSHFSFVKAEIDTVYMLPLNKYIQMSLRDEPIYNLNIVSMTLNISCYFIYQLSNCIKKTIISNFISPGLYI